MYKYILIFLAIIVVLRLVYDSARVYRYVRIGKEFSKRTVPYQQHPANPTSRILVLGDSTAVGSGSATPQQSTAGRLGHDHPNADITNLAKNGTRLADVAKIMPTLSGHYNLILIQAGANDIIRFTDTKQITNELEQIFSQATKLFDHVVAFHSGNVGLAPFFPFYTKSLFAWRTRQLRAIYKTAAEKHNVIYVDLYTERNDDPFNPNYSYFYAADSLHLNGAGYGVWYEKITAALAKNAIIIP